MKLFSAWPRLPDNFLNSGFLTHPHSVVSGILYFLSVVGVESAAISFLSIEWYVLIFSMMKKYSRPMSLKSIQNPGSTVRNTLFANWSEKNIAAIHESWFGLHGPMIQSIDLHQNKIKELPDCFFEMLPNLEDLDISVNLLTSLPERGIDRCKYVVDSLPVSLAPVAFKLECYC